MAPHCAQAKTGTKKSTRNYKTRAAQIIATIIREGVSHMDLSLVYQKYRTASVSDSVPSQNPNEMLQKIHKAIIVDMSIYMV
jgi:hypothetical protein